MISDHEFKLYMRELKDIRDHLRGRSEQLGLDGMYLSKIIDMLEEDRVDKSSTIYLSGPWNPITVDGKHFTKEDNERTASEYGLKLLKKGWTPFIPHRNNVDYWGMQCMSHAQWIESDLKMVAACSKIFMLPNWPYSKGAKMEWNEAKRLGKDIIFYQQDIPQAPHI